MRKKFKNKLNNSGFTLAELLVSVSVFAVMSVLISGVYLNANNLQQKVASFQRLQNDGRYIVEKLAKEIRSREIDFPLQAVGTRLDFAEDRYGEIATVEFVGDEIIYSIFDGTNTYSEPLNAEDVAVVEAKFSIMPINDPFTKVPEADMQPRVTILLQLRNKNVRPEDIQELTFQTTVSNKVYKR